MLGLIVSPILELELDLELQNTKIKRLKKVMNYTKLC